MDSKLRSVTGSLFPAERERSTKKDKGRRLTSKSDRLRGVIPRSAPCVVGGDRQAGPLGRRVTP
jgi:hypothetical protein